jgi:hypothetical protein
MGYGGCNFLYMLFTLSYGALVCTVSYLIWIVYLHFELFSYYKKGCEQSSICHLLYPLAGLLQVSSFLPSFFMILNSIAFQYVSATLNPLIYNLMSLKFRKAFFCLWGAVFHTSSVVGKAANKKVKVVTMAKVNVMFGTN